MGRIVISVAAPDEKMHVGRADLGKGLSDPVKKRKKKGEKRKKRGKKERRGGKKKEEGEKEKRRKKGDRLRGWRQRGVAFFFFLSINE